MKIVINFALVLITALSYGQSTLSTAIKKCLPTVFVIKTYDENYNELGIGTGFFIDSLGTGITNYHVLQGAKKAIITLQDERKFGIDYTWGEDEYHDLIRFSIASYDETIRFKYLRIASKPPQLGEDVFTIGNPKGLSFSTSNGIVSSIRDEEFGTIIQTTAPISPGSSGSPLLNLKGEVVGVISFFFKEGQNLNFAFSSKYIKQLSQTQPKYSFPEEDVSSKVIDAEENYFKRQDWYVTQYMVKSSENAILVSDEINSATSKPELEYFISLGGKPLELNYEFEGGRLNEISYWAIFGMNGTEPIRYVTLNDAFNVFQILYGEITARLGPEIGCWRGSAFAHNMGSWEPAKNECFSSSTLTTWLFRSEAKKAFEEYDVKNGKVNEGDIFYYRIHWQTKTSKYILQIGLHRNHQYWGAVITGEAFCNLSIEPVK